MPMYVAEEEAEVKITVLTQSCSCLMVLIGILSQNCRRLYQF